MESSAVHCRATLGQQVANSRYKQLIFYPAEFVRYQNRPNAYGPIIISYLRGGCAHRAQEPALGMCLKSHSDYH